MSSINDIRAAWDSAIFDHATIKGFTTSVYPFEVPNLESGASSSLFYYDAEINFITFVVSRVRRDGISGKVTYEFPVRVRYYRENEPSGANFKASTDVLETLDSLVRSELGNTWSQTVDFYTVSETGIRSPELVFLENKAAWATEVTYTGIQTVSL